MTWDEAIEKESVQFVEDVKKACQQLNVESPKNFHGLNPEAYKGFSQDALDYAAKLQNKEDPNGIPQHEPGAKNDNGKAYASLLLNFPRALKAVAEVATYGARKYTRDGWEAVPDGITRYRDAEWRHMLEGKLEELDQESGLPHAWHRCWNVIAVLELELREKELRRQNNELHAT